MRTKQLLTYIVQEKERKKGAYLHSAAAINNPKPSYYGNPQLLQGGVTGAVKLTTAQLEARCYYRGE